MEVHSLTVGPVAEHCYILHQPGSKEAVVVDPGDEFPRIVQILDRHELTVKAILITHTHFDHVCAVAELARHTGAPVYCPNGESHILANIGHYTKLSGLPITELFADEIEPYDAEVKLEGGERINLAGIAIEVLSTPGHSPDHMCYWIEGESALFSGDLIFQDSIGRTDLPGSDAEVQMKTLAQLFETLPDETVIYPGHMGVTSIGTERQNNPFLQALPSA